MYMSGVVRRGCDGISLLMTVGTFSFCDVESLMLLRISTAWSSALDMLMRGTAGKAAC